MSIFISCGSNLGDRRRNIERAIERLLSNDKVRLLKRSSYYETSPVEYRQQPDFLNNVIEVATQLEPQELLGKLKQIEKEVNPEKRIAKGPRVVDLDILLYDDLMFSTQTLTLPHKSICRRRFVLIPLLQIAPDLQSPVDGRRYSEYLAAIDDPEQEVRVLA